MAFTLPKIQAADSIVDGTGRPTTRFLKFFNFDFARAIERNDNAQSDLIAKLQVLVNQLQVTTEAVQQAQNAANQAQQSADGAGGGVAVSGTSTAPDVTLVGSAWVLGPVVALTGVVAGSLTITGSGPLQDDNVSATGPRGNIPCQFRVVEVILGVDTVLFTGSFSVFTTGAPGDVASVINSSASAVGAFSSARSSTGAVSYRIDARTTTTDLTVADLSLYLFVRRA